MANYDVFISYRREGGADFARQMQLALKTKGYNVFLDFDELKDGVFENHIEAAIKSSKVFLLILSPKALDNCKNENDCVSKEMECALVSQCTIVPFDANQGFDNIDEFVHKSIAPIVAPRKTETSNEATTGAEVHIETDIACRVMRYKEELITAVPDDDNIIFIKKGTHKLTFVSVENEQDRYSQVYTVSYDCGFLEVSLTKIRDERLAKEEAERKRLAEDDAKYKIFYENGKSGYKKDGVVVIPAKYYFAYDFSEGLARVALDGKYGFIDKTGKEVISIKYDSAGYFTEGLAMVLLNRKYGFIDRGGKEVIPIKYDWVELFSEGLVAVELNGKRGYIDRTGKEVIPIKYSDVCDFSEGLAAVELNGKRGFIDRGGKEVIPFKYDGAMDFSEGLARVGLDGKYGYIDKTGNEVIPIKYDWVELFSEDIAMVKLNGKCGYIDRNGKEVIPFKYDVAMGFREGLARVKLNRKYGFIDKNGKEVIPIKYDDAYDFRNGKALVYLNGKRGYIDKQGNFIPREW